MNTIDLSMTETVIMMMALHQMLKHNMSQKDRETAMLLECPFVIKMFRSEVKIRI